VRIFYLGLVALAVSARAQSLTLVERGRSHAVVLLSAQPAEDERFAAAELVKYLKKVTGAETPVASHAPPGARIRIHVGPGACPPPVRDRIQKLRGDGYLVEVAADGGIFLAGQGRHGTSFAVYEFLERFAGVRWLWPGELGEVVPQRETLTAATASIAKEPAFLWRDLGPGGALWGPADRWEKERELGVSAAHQEQMRLWERRNRFGGLRILGGHAFGRILPPARYGPSHPEYYALVGGRRDWQNFNGKHRAQLCTSNPEVVRLVTEYCRRLFDEHPEIDAVSISPNDGRGFCECDRCQRLDTGAIYQDRADPETGRAGALRVISDRMMRFGNDVAEGVSKTHPGKKVLLLAYSQYHQPPQKTKAGPHLIVQYTLNASGLWNPPYRANAFEDLEGWGSMAQEKAVYGYLTQGNFPDMPRLMPDLIALELRQLEKLGYRYYETQAGNGFAVNGFNFYALGRLLWNPSSDPREILSEYVTSGFGAAAGAIMRYFNRQIESWKSQRSAPVTMNDFTAKDYEAVLGAYPPEFREACRRDLEQAMQQAGGDARKRVAFLMDGWRYVEMTLRAAEKSLPLLRAGWKPGAGLEPPAGIDRARIVDAIQAWEDRDRYIEAHKEDFVLSYMWVRYNDELRSFNPLRRFRMATGRNSMSSGRR
jgi:hypothetical protein